MTTPTTTPLHKLHVELGGKMVPFAGYEMPIQFSGIIAEHTHTRAAASLFDVSHMCQLALTGEDRVANLQRLVSTTVAKLRVGRSKYTFMCNNAGGVIDDMIVSNFGDRLGVVCNASRKTEVIAHTESQLTGDCQLQVLDQLGLLALQGPQSAAVLQELGLDLTEFYFMDTKSVTLAGFEIQIGRTGYTGEDGFEISIAGDKAVDFAKKLLGFEAVLPAGLGARDSLRLEVGLCLYGNELDETISPIEANLTWAIPPSRRLEGGYIGEQRVSEEINNGAKRTLIALQVAGRSPVRTGAEISTPDGQQIGKVTSGSWSPSCQTPLALALVEVGEYTTPDSVLQASLRGRSIQCEVVKLPFLATKYVVRPRKQK